MLRVVTKKYESDSVKTELSPVAKAIVKTLLYFDIFHYPLLLDEIHEYCCQFSASKEEIEKQLKLLEENGYVSRKHLFYMVKNDNIEAMVERRIKGNREAQKFLKRAKSFIKLISYFPFVRGICLSGSLSKGYADKDSDVDYFIITEPGRLWISRTLLILFKKIFLLNSHKYFCVNYFIDTDTLEIPDKNLFAATEMVSMIPVYNAELYEKLMAANAWVKDFYPNGRLKTERYPVVASNNSFIRKGMEWMLSGKTGAKLDNWCFKKTLATWKKKFDYFNESEFDLNLRTRKNVSKHHPNGFQLKVMRALDEKIQDFEMKFNVSIG